MGRHGVMAELLGPRERPAVEVRMIDVAPGREGRRRCSTDRFDVHAERRFGKNGSMFGFSLT